MTISQTPLKLRERRQDAPQQIRFFWCDSPFGAALVFERSEAICGLAFSDERQSEKSRIFQDMSNRFPNHDFELTKSPSTALPTQIFNHAEDHPDIDLSLDGSAFQQSVWQALRDTPSFETRTYSQIALAINRPRAVRAVASAIGRNPISWLIPCHRVLRKDGTLGGYHWGLPRKRAMLAYEQGTACKT